MINMVNFDVDKVIEIVSKYDKKKLSESKEEQEKLLSEIFNAIGIKFESLNELYDYVSNELEKIKNVINQIDDLILSLDNKQWAFKISANSIYGAFGDKVSRLYNPLIAEGITTVGQLLSKSVQDYINDELGIPVIYGDTDSVFLSLNDVIPEDIKQKGEDEVREWIYQYLKENLYPKVNEYINKKVKEWFNVEPDKHVFEFKQEIIARRGIFLKSKSKDKEYAKKRYALWIIDKEGAKKDELLLTGLEIKRSELPNTSKEVLTKFLERILKENVIDKDLLLEFKKNIIKWCKEYELDKICLNQGISKKLSEYKSKDYVIIGAEFYQNVIAKMFNLPEISAGTKVMVVFVKKFNIVKDEKYKEYNTYLSKYRNKLKAIVIPHDVYKLIPKEFFKNTIEIDEHTTVRKLIIEPIEGILITLNINPEKLLIKDTIGSLLK